MLYLEDAYFPPLHVQADGMLLMEAELRRKAINKTEKRMLWRRIEE